MITVDARGDQCPIPVIKTKKAVEALTGPETVETLVDNEIAVQNVTRFGESKGAGVTSEKLGDKEFKITLTLSDQALAKIKEGAASPQEDEVCLPDARGNSIVVISSATMGVGNDELGKVLIKGFLYALSQLDVLPKKLLFYNGGAQLTTEGSASLEDLKGMEAQGVEILTCGTCLDYYGLKDKLAVGSVTNMYAIVEAMDQAAKIIKPC